MDSRGELENGNIGSPFQWQTRTWPSDKIYSQCRCTRYSVAHTPLLCYLMIQVEIQNVLYLWWPTAQRKEVPNIILILITIFVCACIKPWWTRSAQISGVAMCQGSTCPWSHKGWGLPCNCKMFHTVGPRHNAFTSLKSFSNKTKSTQVVFSTKFPTEKGHDKSCGMFSQADSRSFGRMLYC